MPRQAGTPKTGGRQKGTPNRKSTELAERLASLCLDVPAEIAKVLPDLDPETRANVLLELMTFLYPKRKALEVEASASIETKNITVSFVSPVSSASTPEVCSENSSIQRSIP